MDGNGRWAKQRSYPRLVGHKKGADSVRAVVKAAGEIGLEALTLFAFSEENWGRPFDEVSGIMKLLETYLVRERKELMNNGVRFKAFGNLNRLSERTRVILSETEDMLSKNSGLKLNLALSYGGRQEIVMACRSLAEQVKAGLIDPSDISEEVFRNSLFTRDLTDPDLLIRTSGEQRISNFLLWQMAYTEFYFTDTFWPDFGRADFLAAIRAFQLRDRRFGLVKPEISKPSTTAMILNESANTLC